MKKVDPALSMSSIKGIGNGIDMRRMIAGSAFAMMACVPFAANAQKRTPIVTPLAPIGDQGAWFPLGAYPVEARRAWEQGRVSASLDVDAGGMPTACVVDVSSGSASLDRATCALAMANARFTPATVDGKPIAAKFKLRNVAWALEPADPLDLTAGEKLIFDNAIEVTMDAQGVKTGCRVIRKYNPQDDAPQDDYCASIDPSRIVPGPIVSGGKPVGARIILGVSARVIPEDTARP